MGISRCLDHIPVITNFAADRLVAFDSSFMRSPITACLAQNLDFLLCFGLFRDSRFDFVLCLLNVGILKIDQDGAVELVVPENVLETQVALLDTQGGDLVIGL